MNRFKLEDCRAIAATFGVPVEDIERIMWKRRFSDGAQVSTLDTIKVTKSYLMRPLRPQLCTLCMAEHMYCRLNWDLQFVCVCHVHSCMLVDQCPQCRRYLQWMRPFLQHCNCGIAWKKVEPNYHESTSPGTRLASIFQHKLRPASADFCPLDPFESTLSALSVDAISKLIWIFGFKECIDHHIGPGRSQQILRTKQASMCVERGYLRLRALCYEAATDDDTVLESINLAALKSFVRDADSIPDIRFAEWLSREITRRSQGKYSMGVNGRQQLCLF